MYCFLSSPVIASVAKQSVPLLCFVDYRHAYACDDEKEILAMTCVGLVAQERKKTTKRGKSFAKYGKDVAKGLLDSAKGRFDDEKT